MLKRRRRLGEFERANNNNDDNIVVGSSSSSSVNNYNIIIIRKWTILDILLITGMMIVSGVVGGKTPSGLYHDDGKGHTVLTQRFSQKDVSEISYDLLNIMGFHHRPHPHLIDNKSPASQFLLEVYNSLDGSDADVDLSNGENGRRQSWRQAHHLKNLTWSEFNVDQKEAEVITQADAIISFVNRGHRFSKQLKKHAEDKQFWFDVSEVSNPESILSAEFRLWKKTLVANNKDDYDWSDYSDETDTDGHRTPEVIRISVNQVIKKSDKNFVLDELDEIVAAKWEQGWLRLNVTSAFKQWIRDPESNFGLVISTKSAESGQEIDLERTGLATKLEDDKRQPFLVSFLKGGDDEGGERINNLNNNKQSGPRPGGGGGRRRVIRSTKQKRNKKSKKNQRPYDFPEILDRPRSCQMGMLYVNFEDLGWKDWVIAPDGFIAYYCHGECSFPLTASMNATNHAIVSTLVHTYYPLEYPKPSCAPVKLGSISMLYYDDNSNVTVKKYKDMVIKSCGCK